MVHLCGRLHVAVIVLCVVQLAVTQDFGYDGDLGPSHWGEQYNKCLGKHQSPINIDSLTVTRAVLPPLIMTGFDTPPDKTKVINNGHTVMYTLDAAEQPTISGGPLNFEYEFAQLHFHWGDNDTLGSEDLIDGVSYPMELHMVFYKKSYRNTRQALEHPDGLTVLAFFYEIQEQDNAKYDEFTSIVSNLTTAGESRQFEKPPTMRDLLPNDLVHYFTYNGSLTTPPCSEVVTWIDFKQPIPLSHKQIDSFRALQDNHGQHLTHNFRPIQDLGDRIVLFNIESEQDNTLESQIVNKPDDEIPVEPPLDPSTVYEHDQHNRDDDDDDVGIGSVQQNHHPAGSSSSSSSSKDDANSDNNELLMSDSPQLDRDVMDSVDEERAGNPKLKALKKGKDSGATTLSFVSRVGAVLVAVVAVFMF